MGRLWAATAAIAVLALNAGCSGAKPPTDAAGPVRERPEPGVTYVGGGATGLGQAVIVKGVPLVYTRQVLALDSSGRMVGGDVLDQQVDQALANLETILKAAGTTANNLVRVNIYAPTAAALDLVRQRLSRQLDRSVSPVVTAVESALSHPKALVAVDAIAAAEKVPSVPLQRAADVAGDQDCADFAVLPCGGVAYLSGQPEPGELAPASARSLAALRSTLERLHLQPGSITQIRVFLTPVAAAETVLREIKKLFPNQLAPPVVFVESRGSAAVEIELLAAAPPEKPGDTVDLYNPPDATPSPGVSRVALVRTDRQVFLTGLVSRREGDDTAQAHDVFGQIKALLARTGGAGQHLVKATYLVGSDAAGSALAKVRAEYLDPARPPAAAQAIVRGVGSPGRSLLIDLIAAGPQPPGKK